jgi:membrane protein DedA with SNARE-associated domain
MSFSQHDLMQLVSSYGYWGVGGIIALESMGIPLPGETALVAAAIYAGTTHELNIWLVIAAAAGGAIATTPDIGSDARPDTACCGVTAPMSD